MAEENTTAAAPLTVVLVHGAFADASGWTGVIERLQAGRMQVTAPANPLCGISIDSAYIASLLYQIPGPVVAFSHSYGGEVITNAATNVNNVVGLVYVAAFAPDEGESLIDIESTSKDSVLNTALVPLQYPTGEGSERAVEFAIDPEKFHDAFASDLRGYGDSSKPETAPEPYSKMTMALDQVEVMKHFGFERFALCGHDRGGCVGYRMALDNPGGVTKLAVLDIVPTWEAFSRTDMAFGLSYWHWFFLAQPYDLPERLLAADPEKTLFRGGRKLFHPEAMEEYVRCLRNPETIHATCEDYRAAATLDYEHDAKDRQAGRRIACPVLALWGRQGFLEELYDVLEVWR